MRIACSILVVAVVLVGCAYAAAAPAVPPLIIGATIRDQGPNYMTHKNFPANYWTCAYGDNPTLGNSGKANGGIGIVGTDFELPQWAYGQVNGVSTATSCPEIGGGVEYGMMGPLCNTSNNFENCATLTAAGLPNYIYPGKSPLGSIQSPASFATWFQDSNNTVTIPYNLTLNNIGGKTYQYNNSNFFPIDGQGWGDQGYASDGNYHNFGFCLEIHGYFSYTGGEIFSFTGDDDLWVYLDEKLVIDIGGPHPALTANVNVDQMGLSLTYGYSFDMFYCERHTTESNLFLTTSINVQCSYYDWCGVCQGSGQTCCTANITETTCNDNNACTVDSCAVLVPPTVSCQHTPLDCALVNNECFTTGCQNTSGCFVDPVTCNDNSVCTVDSCVNATGCLFTNITCSGDKCDIPSCDKVTGCFTTAVNCDDNNACTLDSCDPLVGCKNDAILCNDNNTCTTDTCSKTTGCVFTPNPPCNDDNLCTTDTCIAATGCSYTPTTCAAPNACSTANCGKTTGCVLTNVTCTPPNKCVSASCNPSTGCAFTAISCDDSNACTLDSCVNATGCSHQNISCDDNNACTVDSCNVQAGCVNTPITCSKGNACTNNTCDTVNGCTYPTLTCANLGLCSNVTCDPVGGCIYQNVDCSSNSPCFLDSCNAATGCVHTPQSCNHCLNSSGAPITCPPGPLGLCFPISCDPNSGACNVTRQINCTDTTVCTTDFCLDGICHNDPINCTDNDLCTVDSCDAVTGCLHVEMNCNDNNPCTIDGCNLGNCTTTPVGGNCIPCGGAACNWTDPCNPKACVNNVCTIVPFSCNDNNLCTTDTCSISGTTANCTFTPVVCVTTDLCDPQSCSAATGACVGTPTNCDDGNACTDDACSTLTGAAQCVHPPVSCDQSDLCSPQSCNATNGACYAIPVVCNDGNACTNDFCDPENGTCGVTLVSCADYDTGNLCVPPTCDSTIGCTAGTTICTNNNPCTVDLCVGYMNCSIELGDLCDDNNACTVDSCNGSAASLDDACSHTNISCPAPTKCQVNVGCNVTSGCLFEPYQCPNSTNYCLIPNCDNNAGCVFYNRGCTVVDVNCYVATCNNATQACETQQVSNWVTAQSANKKGETCFVAYDKGTAAAIITGGVIAGIVIAAVVAALLVAAAGRQAFLYMQLRQGGMGPASSNPLYAGGGGSGENPLFNS